MSGPAWPRLSRRISRVQCGVGDSRLDAFPRSGPRGCVANWLIYDVDSMARFGGVGLSRLGFPGIPQHPDRTGEVFGDDGADGFGNGWAEIQPGELVPRHPLPADEARS